ncbi:MAG: bifunctional DNA-formamidopyrimidine glycosylase/DNA-(apurinic or apyrimidinic site) lyase [Deltaproteobacteria bacterium]|nr:bifunctional DNA-formamidopyrimidine glycosylase/DNA-(apurinic or apyrimidinic site) lyase [Candidatus Anaeroferrophillacea bacterium]
MPELPEVETVATALRPHLVGRRVMRVCARVERLREPLDMQALARLEGEAVTAVYRRAKYLLLEFAGCRLVLLIHLGMSGRLRLAPVCHPLAGHEHVDWELDNGNLLRLRDPRRFGLVKVAEIVAPGDLPAELDGLGPEPLEPEFTDSCLAAACRGRRRPIKNLIMDSRVVVGVGNIYASEVLHRAGIRPGIPAGDLRPARIARLVVAIRTVLTAAIAAGGTTINDFAGVDGREGYFSRELQVYARAGERCLRCRRGCIRREVLVGRASYYCPVCQR